MQQYSKRERSRQSVETVVNCERHHEYDTKLADRTGGAEELVKTNQLLHHDDGYRKGGSDVDGIYTPKL
jgi:hypothetical protein